MQDVKMTELKMQDVKMMELIGRFKNDRPDRKGENDEREISIVLIVTLPNCFCFLLFGPGRRVPKSHVSYFCCCCCCCCYQFSKNPEGFLNTQRSATKLCIHIRADLATTLLKACRRFCKPAQTISHELSTHDEWRNHGHVAKYDGRHFTPNEIKIWLQSKRINLK